MNNDLRKAIAAGELVLFLGAGASRNSLDQKGGSVLDGNGLAERLANEAGLPFSGEPLNQVYSAVRQKLQGRLDPILESLFRFCTPSAEYVGLATYAWRRIYSLNIDDAFERALTRYSGQQIAIRIGSDPLKERDPIFRRLDYVKLNGCVSRLHDGLIFSPAEYAKAAITPRPWYEESAADFLKSPFLFIGTKLDEPLFKFHIERYKQTSGAHPGTSFVLTPAATEIQRLDLKAYNIEHIAGSLADFLGWLQKEFPVKLISLDLAKASLPQFAEMMRSEDAAKHASLFTDVTHVSRSALRVPQVAKTSAAISSFFKGFKPSWFDIIHAIPAELDALQALINHLKARRQPGKLLPVIGPAGSGKTTLLMQAALKASDWESTSIYFINEPVKNLKEIVESLETGDISASVVVFIDKIGFVADQLADLLASNRLRKTTIVGAERQNIWHKRVNHVLGVHARNAFMVNEFSVSDAERLLVQLEGHGSWTRLGQLKPEARIAELVSRAQRQLLIALLEATSGRGFEQIIESDYDSLSSDAERLYLILVGLATIQRLPMPAALANRALVQLSLAGQVSELTPALSGIIVAREGRLLARHELYVRHLFEKHVDPTLVEKAIAAILRAFALIEAPVIKNLPKADAAIYKATINHRFLFGVLRGKRDLVLGLYRSLEKRYERDGLFWLQYGLALRDFAIHDEALEKLRTAASAYRMDHTEHALAQQLLILAEGSSVPAKATAYLDEAKEILTRLDRTIVDSDDTYPIVTLAESHTKVVRKFEGEDAARRLAAQYANQIESRLDDHAGHERLRLCWEALVKYASVGTWAPSKFMDTDGLP